jgi:hypothetical protein
MNNNETVSTIDLGVALLTERIFAYIRVSCRYQMKTGPNVSDVVPYKEFNVAEILEEVTAMGFMSDFHPAQKELEAYQTANGGPEATDLLVLVVHDENETYGDNFYMCTTLEARDAEFGKAKAAADAVAAEAEAKRLAEEARAQAEYDRLNAVYQDVPVYAKPYTSATAVATQEDIAKAAQLAERPRMVVQVARPRSSFGGRCPKFGARDSDNDSKQVEFLGVKNPEFDLRARVRDVALQAPEFGCLSAGVRHAEAQTPWFRKVNMSTQYDGFDPGQEKGALPPPPRPDPSHGGGHGHHHHHHHHGAHGGAAGGALGPEALAAASDERFLAFLRATEGVMEEALQQNETVDIFKDAFAKVGDEDGAIGQKGDNDLKEIRTFNDIRYSKNMALACIDWHPKKKGVVAVAPLRNLSFAERMDAASRPFTSCILLWSFTDLIHPELMLESPHEMACFKFNRCPGQTDIVVAGSLSGQVLLFDLSQAMAKLAAQAHKPAAAAAASRANTASGSRSGGSANMNVSADEGEAPGIEPLQPVSVSLLETSHGRLVKDLAWMPPNEQMDAKGQRVAPEHRADGKSYQFITVSGDGLAMVWDIRFAAIAAGELPHIFKVRGADKKRDENPKWLPLFKMELKRTGSIGGDLSLARIALLSRAADAGPEASAALLRGNSSNNLGSGSGKSGDGEGAGNDDENDDNSGAKADLEAVSISSSSFLCASEEGELAMVDWRPPKPLDTGKKAPGQEENDDKATDEAPEYVCWVAPDHARPSVALEPSPFFPSLLASVGDFHFTLWVLGRTAPVFRGPGAASYLTCGRWSPSRPGLLFLGRVDGCLDLWDLTESSYKPAATVTVSSTRVTSLEFLVNNQANNSSSSETTAASGAAAAGTGSSSSGKNKGAGANKGNQRSELLAVGDAAGNLHVFELPRNLWRPTTGEKSLMAAFVAREVKRCDFETVARVPASEEDPPPFDGEDPPPSEADEEEEGEAAPAAGGDGDGESVVDPEVAAQRAEAKDYDDLEQLFIDQLGLEEAELPDLWRKAAAEKRRLAAEQAEAEPEQ